MSHNFVKIDHDSRVRIDSYLRQKIEKKFMNPGIAIDMARFNSFFDGKNIHILEKILISRVLLENILDFNLF